MVEGICNVTEHFVRTNDAISTNRGFYFQYLNVLKKWLKVYIDGSDEVVFTEVENDIKEIGDKYIFTQLKCYTSDFSLNSKEIKHSIFDFFILYLKYVNNNIDLRFSFVTNSTIKKNEKLLNKWFNGEIFNNASDFDTLKKKIRDIIKYESKKIKEKKLNKKDLSEEIKQSINDGYEVISSIFMDDLVITKFCNCIIWEFGNQSPVDAIKKLKYEIFDLLKNKGFKGRSPDILFRVLLSEIYKCSQEANEDNRSLSRLDLVEILNSTDSEIEKTIDTKLISVFNIELEELKERIEKIETTQEKYLDIVNDTKFSNKSNTDFTLIPYVSNIENIIGWDKEIKDVHKIINQKTFLSISNFGGVGKTTFIKKYLYNYRKSYNNLVWLNIENSLINEFVLNGTLISNLNIKLEKELTLEQQFDLIINTLDKYGENNLIILDIQSNCQDIIELSKVLNLRNWKKIILSREQNKYHNPYRLPCLDYKQSKKLFEMHCSKVIVDDSIFKEFLQYIDYNNLVIELVAKTIESSYDLTIEFIFESLKEKKLDTELLNIDIELSEQENRTVRIFDFIIQKFTINNLNKEEKYYLEYLSILPSYDIVLEDLILICGKDYYDYNKVEFVNWTNSLERKGLILYEKDRKSFSIHKILQDAVLYSMRKNINAFSGLAFYISWLVGRLSEGYNSPKESFRYLRYAESIINSIKEDYRGSVYQPLLLLENEYLHLSSFFFSKENNSDLWLNLVTRSEKYLGKKNLILASMYNNLALSLSKNESIDEVKKYLKTACNICISNFSTLKFENILKYITVLNNLTLAFLYNNEIDNAIKNFQKVSKIRKKFNIYNDVQVGVEYNILSELYFKSDNLEKSEEFVLEAIKFHNSVPMKDRNDFLLASYYNKLSEYSLLKNNINKAIDYQLICVNILEREEVNNHQIKTMYKYIIDLYKIIGDEENLIFFRNKLHLLLK